ncbi:hypothetical protein P7C71_g1304, partial [Lecanoromycetidae sp. Uapishka_2]
MALIKSKQIKDIERIRGSSRHHDSEHADRPSHSSSGLESDRSHGSSRRATATDEDRRERRRQAVIDEVIAHLPGYSRRPPHGSGADDSDAYDYQIKTWEATGAIQINMYPRDDGTTTDEDRRERRRQAVIDEVIAHLPGYSRRPPHGSGADDSDAYDYQIKTWEATGAIQINMNPRDDGHGRPRLDGHGSTSHRSGNRHHTDSSNGETVVNSHSGRSSGRSASHLSRGERPRRRDNEDDPELEPGRRLRRAPALESLSRSDTHRETHSRRPGHSAESRSARDDYSTETRRRR